MTANSTTVLPDVPLTPFVRISRPDEASAGTVDKAISLRRNVTRPTNGTSSKNARFLTRVDGARPCSFIPGRRLFLDHIVDACWRAQGRGGPRALRSADRSYLGGQGECRRFPCPFHGWS